MFNSKNKQNLKKVPSPLNKKMLPCVPPNVFWLVDSEVLLSVTNRGWGGTSGLPAGLLLHTQPFIGWRSGAARSGGTCWRRGLGDESLDYAAGAVHSENEKRGRSQHTHTAGCLLIILLITCNVVVGDFFQAGPDWWALRWHITSAGKIDQTTKHTYY